MEFRCTEFGLDFVKVSFLLSVCQTSFVAYLFAFSLHLYYYDLYIFTLLNGLSQNYAHFTAFLSHLHSFSYGLYFLNTP